MLVLNECIVSISIAKVHVVQTVQYILVLSGVQKRRVVTTSPSTATDSCAKFVFAFHAPASLLHRL